MQTTLHASHKKPHVGRFAPSPTGALHMGSLVTAMASHLDAKAHAGKWLVRIEDVDKTRCHPHHSHMILQQLTAFGLPPDADGAVVYQSHRGVFYDNALEHLKKIGAVYPCFLSRNNQNQTAPAWKSKQTNMVLQRRDGCHSYTLAVVVDDALQNITHVVRGMDLLAQTPEQIVLQQQLGFTTPHYQHVRLVLAGDGGKLSKQNGAIPLPVDSSHAIGQCLNQAADHLGLPPSADANLGHIHPGIWQNWVEAWATRFKINE